MNPSIRVKSEDFYISTLTSVNTNFSDYKSHQLKAQIEYW